MNEGVGSTTIIVIIMVFITVVSAYMAYNVNYTKAFRMKNKIISLYEEYDGVCTNSLVNGETKSCRQKLAEYGKEIGYSGADLNCSNNPFKPTGTGTLLSTQKVNLSHQGVLSSFCEYKMKGDTKASGSDIVDENPESYYYRIVTRIDIQIPIVQNVFQLRLLNVSGDTKLFIEK